MNVSTVWCTDEYICSHRTDVEWSIKMTSNVCRSIINSLQMNSDPWHAVRGSFYCLSVFVCLKAQRPTNKEQRRNTSKSISFWSGLQYVKKYRSITSEGNTQSSCFFLFYCTLTMMQRNNLRNKELNKRSIFTRRTLKVLRFPPTRSYGTDLIWSDLIWLWELNRWVGTYRHTCRPRRSSNLSAMTFKYFYHYTGTRFSYCIY